MKPVARWRCGASWFDRLTMKRTRSRFGLNMSDPFTTRRDEMVDHQIAAMGVTDPKVLAAMRKVPRHEFVPEWLKDAAYRDGPLPIGENQTISQPYVVA